MTSAWIMNVVGSIIKAAIGCVILFLLARTLAVHVPPDAVAVKCPEGYGSGFLKDEPRKRVCIRVRDWHVLQSN